MPASAVQIKNYRPEVIREAVLLFDRIGYEEDYLEDVYRVAIGKRDSAPTKADGVNLARTAFATSAARETAWLIERDNLSAQSIWATLKTMGEAWPVSDSKGRSSVLAVLAEDQYSCPDVVQEAQNVALRWVDLLAQQLRCLPALRAWREARVKLLASELVASLVSGYRLSITYRNYIHFHRLLDHWRRQLSFWTTSPSAFS